VRVAPRASRNALARDASGGLRVHLTAPPVDGAANEALVAFLAERLGLPKRALEITAGARGRSKIVTVSGCEAADLERRIALATGSAVDKAGARG
jgi:uncharacterized protein YggU (UPF0235/DUF167 family)